MAIYEFIDMETGETVQRSYAMGCAPSIGACIVDDEGRKLQRAPSLMRPPVVKKSITHISRVLPKGTPGADGYTKEGYAIVQNQATVDRIRKLNPQYDYGESVVDERMDTMLGDAE